MSAKKCEHQPQTFIFFLQVTEYQVLRECLWTLRNPLCNSSPLFTFNAGKEAFVVNRFSLEPQFILLLWRNTSLVEVWVLEADNCWHCLVETSLLNASSHNAALVPSIVSFYIVFEVFKWFSQMLTPF